MKNTYTPRHRGMTRRARAGAAILAMLGAAGGAR